MSGKITLTDLVTFTGIMNGTSVTHVSGYGYKGTWTGHRQEKLTGFGGSSYKAVAHGTGDLAGMKVMMTSDSTRTPVFTGRFLEPHGG